LRVIENRVLRRTSGPKTDEVTGCWRKLCNDELHSIYLSPNIVRMMKSRTTRWVGYVSHMGEMKNVNRTLVGMPELKRTLRRPRHRWGGGN
jgi:hypothetical protein